MATRRVWNYMDGLGFVDTNTNQQDNRIVSITGRNCHMIVYDANRNVIYDNLFLNEPSTDNLGGGGVPINQIGNGRYEGLDAQFQFVYDT